MYYEIEFTDGYVIEPISLMDGVKQISDSWCVNCFGEMPDQGKSVAAIKVHFLNSTHMFSKAAVDEFNKKLDSKFLEFQHNMKIA